MKPKTSPLGKDPDVHFWQRPKSHDQNIQLRNGIQFVWSHLVDWVGYQCNIVVKAGFIGDSVMAR